MARHASRAGTALAHLAERDPAIAVLALWCTHRDGEGRTRTAGETIWYGRDFEALPLQEQIGLAAHHVLHVAFRHAARAGDLALREGADFEPALCNLAADALVNETLMAAGHALPRPAVRASELLAAALRSPVSPAAALADWDLERLYLAICAPGPAGSNTRRGAAARAYAAAQGFGEDLKPGSGEDARQETPAADWRGRVLRAMEAGRAAGTGIGQLAGRLADLAPPRVPWELHLRRLLAKAASEVPHPSHRRPSGRWVAREAEARRRGRHTPAFEPALLRDRHRPRIVVGLDSSGSIGEREIRMLAAEAAAISRHTGAETYVLAFDDSVYAEERMGPGHWEQAVIGLTLRRGGGTSFEPVLARATALDASIAVLLTDLDGPTGPPPPYPVLWAVPKAPSGPPPFGRVLVLEG